MARYVLHVSEGIIYMFVHIAQNRNIGGVFSNIKKGYNSTTIELKCPFNSNELFVGVHPL